MSAHTPGPWHMAGPVGAGTWIQSDERSNIAAVHGAASEVGRANARLIAAAPELLEALQHAKWRTHPHSPDSCEGCHGVDLSIIKATGGQP